MKLATFKEMKNNIGLYVGLYNTPAHWIYDEEDEETPYKFVSNKNENNLLPPHAKTLKELFDIHLIWYDGSNDLISKD